jgi:hypothetical protein
MGALIALASGLIFGIGLLLSGMTDPQRVLAFLAGVRLGASPRQLAGRAGTARV